MVGQDAAGEAGAAWTDGAVDLHVHASPSFFARWGDGLDVTRACEAAGMAAVLLKAHEGATYDGAAVLDRLSPTLRVRGGIVLNRYVGGLNPAAVEAALRLGGRCVWFPTLDADAHARAFGSTGAFPAQRGGIESPTGIRLLDEAGRCVPEALEVLALAAEHDVLVATGHLSAGEVGELVRSASAAGVRRLLVQHPCFPVPALAADGLEPLVRAGAAVELTYLTVSPRWQTATVAENAELLRRFGGDHVVVASDAGQDHNPPPPEALGTFAQSLFEHGVPERELRKALVDTPARLLGA
jgi:hypothetical protein